MNEYLNSKEVADSLGVCVETARKVIASKMKHIRLGRGELRVSREEVNSYINREQKIPEVTR